ncbi:hypothetical protein H6F74_24805 [Trichocoleus sp. FACHB-90]|uniref:hypothetical protein n=1 Tax=Cyanophyceae TaxID=3028117 RepID=UPI001686867D|nr:hypothetical protein [Trichocoleus sp. FACHB-90]MBD1929438.1 hypothetical protein [Trichocoleus sp. FACHB-90]
MRSQLLLILGRHLCDRVFPRKYGCCVFEVTFLEFTRSPAVQIPGFLEKSGISRSLAQITKL